MNRMLDKKLNLLIHLAKVDGQFVESEKILLRSILEAEGLGASYLEKHQEENVDLGDISRLTEKTELLYWVLWLIHADKVLHPAEIEYSKIVARQLGFDEAIIDHFQFHVIPSFGAFEKIADQFKI